MRWDAWNLPSEGRGVFFSGWSVQPKGPVRWHWSAPNSLHACARIDRDTLVIARSALRTPRMAEQLVDVPVPSFHQCTYTAPFRDGAGRQWYLITGPRGFSWWLVGTDHQQGTPPSPLLPPGITASPGRCINTGQG